MEDEKVTLTFPDPGSFDGDIVKLDQVTFGYSSSDKVLLNNIDISIGIKSRIALLGRNGQGKSTLIKLGESCTAESAYPYYCNDLTPTIFHTSYWCSSSQQRSG